MPSLIADHKRMTSTDQQPTSGAAATDVAGAPLAVVLRWLVHGLLFLLVTVTAARGLATASGGRLAALLILLALMVSVYSLGSRRWAAAQRRQGHEDAPSWSALWHLAPTAVLWMLALAHSPDAVWIAFGLDLAVAFSLPLAGGVPALVVVTVAAIAGYVGWSGDGITAPAFIGPTLGAIVALVGVLAVRALQREVDIRTRLARNLLEAQAELARHEREAATAQERERLSRELHDTVAQSALAIQIMLDATRTALAEEKTARAQELVVEARAAAALTTAQARSLLEDSAREVDPLELPVLLDELAGRGLDGGPQVELRCEQDPQLLGLVPARTASTALRLARTLVSNAVLHADAQRVVVTLAVEPSDLLLDVVDDGVGIPADEVDGVGLRSARARARALGGELTIESSPGAGTAVQARLPLPTAARPEGDAPSPPPEEPA